jgi:hypothetical protein
MDAKGSMMSSTIDESSSENRSGASRRFATRYEPAQRDACLAWWERQSSIDTGSLDECPDSPSRGSHHQFALLLDISHTGASIALDLVPGDGHGVWLRLEGEVTTNWTEADVVGVTKSSLGPHLIRLAFRVPCDFETLQAAVCG